MGLSRGGSLDSCIVQINAWVRGWHGFFGIASASEMQMMRKIDAHLRRRLRAIILHHWKRRRTSRRARCEPEGSVASGLSGPPVLVGTELSHAHAVDQGLRNAYFAKRGLIFVVDLHHRAHQHIAAPGLPQLAVWG
jgi:RNA-directed DNA polymerase